jgi:hypothetical protein
VTATAAPTIDVTAFAGALAVGASGKASATAVSGAGAQADNEIAMTVRAAISDTPAKKLGTAPPPVRSQSGSVLVSAIDTSTVTAVAVGASLAISTGKTYSAGIAVGVSIADNRIANAVTAQVLNSEVGAALVVEVSATSTNTVNATAVAASVSFANGEKAIGISGGGAESKNVILTKTNAYVENSHIVASGDVTLASRNSSDIDAVIVSAALALGFGKKAGAGVAIGASVATNLIGFDDDSDSPRPAEVQAYVLNSTIEAQGNLSLTATADNTTIDAVVVAATAAIAAGRNVGIAAAGSGVDVENKISMSVKAFVEYASGVQKVGAATGVFEPFDGTVMARDVTLLARDTSRITATAVGAALAGAYGDKGGVSIAIGVSLARNDIRNEIEAFVRNADQDSLLAMDYGITFSGSFSAVVIEDATITATAVAASLAAGFSKEAGVALSGAGADATNIILTNANASIQDSRVRGTATGGVSVTASNDSHITAIIVGASLAVGGGLDDGVGVAIGAALARNFIGWDPALGESRTSGQTRAYVENSSLEIGGALSATAVATETIEAAVVAASAAIAASKKFSGAAGGSGSDAVNQVASKVEAFIDGDHSGGIHATSITLSANDTSKITSTAIGAALAASFSEKAAVSIAIGVSLSENRIASQIGAHIKNADDVLSTGGISVTATDQATIHSVAVAASLAAGFSKGVGVALSGAGAESTNVIGTRTNAWVEHSRLSASGPVTITASASSAAGRQPLTAGSDFAVGLDDAGQTDLLAVDATINGTSYEAGTPDPTDVTIDNVFKESLQAILAAAGIELSRDPNDLSVTIRKVDTGTNLIDPSDDTGLEWSVTDRSSGTSVIISKDPSGRV